MKLYLLLPVFLLGFGITGCETMEGFGKDMQKLGDSIEKTASGDDEDDTNE